MNKRRDVLLALLFSALSLGFLVLAFTHEPFFNWAFKRHQNLLSWYIRPLFIIPFCYFAYRRSRAGIAATVFLLFTSMFWFDQPDTVSEEVKGFLQMEREWLRGGWTFSKLIMALLVPISLTALGAAFWWRNLWVGLAVMVLIAVGKMFWSVSYGGESGKSVMLPAFAGLALCIALVYWGFKRAEKKKKADSLEEN